MVVVADMQHLVTRLAVLVVPDGLVVEAVGRRRRGQAAARIASELGAPYSTARFWLRKAGTSRASERQEKEPPTLSAPADLRRAGKVTQRTGFDGLDDAMG